MATIISLPVIAPPTPTDWASKQSSLSPASTSTASVSASVSVASHLKPATLLPAGPAYLAHVRRAIHNHSFDEHDKHEAARQARARDAQGTGAEDDLGVGDEEETPELLALDPKEWKKQDHYAVLGLSHLRFKASQDQIKIAHRKKVLKHHPDKKAGAVGDANDDAFFKCIQKALEVLSHPEKRRQFDSVDPEFMELEEDDAPKEREVKRAVEKDPAAFVAVFGRVFEREARFSKKQPVPGLGAMEDGKEVVEGFYNFWYNFDSWRSFEYLDKEVNEGSDNRDDKRYTEKKNKSERARRKKEDIARVRSLVDLALAYDPRIRRFKQEEKDARAAKKSGKGGKNGGGVGDEAARKAEEEAARIRKAEEAEAEVRSKADAKKAKEKAATEAKKARRAARAAEEAAAANAA